MTARGPRWGLISSAVATCLLTTAAAVPAAAAPTSPTGTPPLTETVASSALAGWSDSQWGDDDTREDERASRLTGKWDAKKDLGSMYSTTRSTRAQDLWSIPAPGSRRKLTGTGVGVALIDTGVAPVEGLATPGKLVYGPDLSFESQTPGTRDVDGYGHGTHMAGIIAGRDSDVRTGEEKSEKNFVGMAPDATLVSVKVGAADGGADLTQVIAAIDWVVAHRADHNIRVLNLSYGLDSAQPATRDPLAHAVENAWRAGIVVVAAAGNDGEAGATRLTMPAVDPYVVAVGSSDHRGSPDRKHTRVGAWTNDGTPERRPDLIAPGKSVVSLRVPGALADVTHPEGRVTGDRDQRLFRGTGTSQSAAVVSGAAALLIQADPTLSPDQIKTALTASADPLKNSKDLTQGAGVLDVKGAYELVKDHQVGPTLQQDYPASTGLGTLEAARGGSHVVDPDNGIVLTGEQDIFGQPWDAPAWAQASAQHRSWSEGTWMSSTWSGPSWSGTSWSAASWSRRSWSGVDWSRRSWSQAQWSRRSWSADDFSRRSWSADNFSRRSWSTGRWETPDTW